MFDLLIATNNDHKIKEYKEMFSPLGINVHSPKEFNTTDEAIENGKTFEENSLIKAKHLADRVKMAVIADDSGLCVDALQGFPGIYSARFAKERGGNAKANLDLIELLNRHDDKDAEFVCVITLLNVEEEPVVFKGVCKGKILPAPVGEGGFGYDPIFYSNEGKVNFGEASSEIKNKYSHRAKALEQLVKYLKDKKLIN